jgi:aconitase A
VTAEQIAALVTWDPNAEGGTEIQFTPARVLLQDFTGVPCVVDLVAMRDAMADLGGDPRRINPLIPSELVIDHSVIADVFGRADAFRRNAQLEFDRNQERYQLLRWAQQSFDGFRVVPPDTGICHQVNLEYLSRVVFTTDGPRGATAFPDTLVGTDSHTPLVNGLGVLGWGVGGIAAEAAMLGSGSSRDWAAKGTLLLGVRAVLATSFERIHRANLIGMGVLPLQFMPGQSPQSLGLTGEETYTITGLAGAHPLPRRVTVRVEADGRSPEFTGARARPTEFTVTVRIDTPAEAAYYRHGGILPYVLRQLLHLDQPHKEPHTKVV